MSILQILFLLLIKSSKYVREYYLQSSDKQKRDWQTGWGVWQQECLGNNKNYNNNDDQGRMKNMTTMKEKKDLTLEILLGHVSKIIL